jgi:hypothetical protein
MIAEQRWGVIGRVTFVVAGFLLLSMGGAIIAAPVTVPLMYVAASRHQTRGFRIAATVLSALTVAESAWALTYLAVEEAQPWIWLVPCLVALSVVGISRHLLPGRRSVGDAPAA